MNLKNLIRASLLIVTWPVAGSALADAANDADYAVAGNLAVTSDYMFRGLTQTWGGPAIQGGADLTMKNGFAAGFWASGISDKTYPGAALELDVYADYGTAIDDDWSWRVGLYSYLYPKGNLDDAGLPSRSFDTVEANASLTWKWLTLKYSDSLTDYFGIDTEQGRHSGPCFLPGRDQVTGMGGLLRRELARPPDMQAPALGGLHPGARAFGDQRALEFSHCAHDVKHEAAAGCRRVDRVRE